MADDWDEQEYVSYLEHERHMYAWCLIKYGNLSPSDAHKSASTFYSYEPANAPYRGLVFHNEAWHWAMLHIFGETYWISRPDLVDQSQDYQDHAIAFDAESGA